MFESLSAEFVAGVDEVSAYAMPGWRIEKRSVVDGSLDLGWGTAGVVAFDPSASIDRAHAIAIDSSFLYVVGGDNSPGSYQWRIEKRCK